MRPIAWTLLLLAASTRLVTAQPLQWPTYSASIIEELPSAPWELAWAGPNGFIGLGVDGNDAAALAGLLDIDLESVELEERGSVVVRTPAGEWAITTRTAGRPVAIYKHIATFERDGAQHAERTWCALYEPKAVRERAGLVVLLPGMFGTPEPVIDAVIGASRERGWHVLRMLTHPSRYTQSATYTLDPGGDLGDAARTIAEELGARTARCALVVDEICARIEDDRPEVPVDRRVGIGMSGGGMALPTVIVRERDAYAAAVFIGAGCDFARIAMDSNYGDWIDAVRIRWSTDQPPESARERFSEAYLGAAEFDGYSTASGLEGLPMLMIHGEVDQAVPAATGDLLWERLGEPERWSAMLGHEALFLAYLPARLPDLMDWLDRATADGEPAPDR